MSGEQIAKIILDNALFLGPTDLDIIRAALESVEDAA